MNEHIFREYDIRGVYPTDINEDVAYTIGIGYGSYIKEKFKQQSCVVSMDNRLSSPSLKEKLIEGIINSGVNVIDYGLTTTPMHFYARHVNNMFGVMITASHNPKDDNGFKFSFDHLSNARGKMIEDFKKYIFAKEYKESPVKGKLKNDDIKKKYIGYLKMGIKLGKKKVKVVLDPGNGVVSTILDDVFKMFNVDYTIINGESDGNFPNHHPDPAEKENLIQLKEKVLELNADLGIGYDGDGDRVGFVKNNGDFMSIEEFMILIIRDIAPKVVNKKFLYDVKCSMSLEDEIKKAHSEGIMFRTGASYTQAATKEMNLPFGGEFSGHVYFRDKIVDVGSAIYASLRLIEILSKNDKSLDELTSDIPKYYATEEIKIPTPDDAKFNIVDKVLNYAREQKFVINDKDGARIEFNGGWALIRASNTGPNLIFRAEAKTEEDKKKLEDYFLTLINKFKGD